MTIYSPKITKADIGKFANRVLGILDKERIENVRDLESKLGTIFRVEEDQAAYILVTTRPSHGTAVTTVEYTIQGVGDSLTFKINTQVGISHFILKCNANLIGYSPCIIDKFGNVIQNKIIYGITMQSIRDELQSLKFYPERDIQRQQA